MRFEKYRCDGCGKEETDPTVFYLRLVHNESTTKNPTSTTLTSESVSVKVPLGNSLDFCSIACFEAYLTKLKNEVVKP
jgi:hypothetical protein